MKDWEIIADNLSKTGWSWGCVTRIICHPAIKNDSGAILNYQGTANDATATDLLCGLAGQ